MLFSLDLHESSAEICAHMPPLSVLSIRGRTPLCSCGTDAGALVAYLWRNRSLSKTSEQLNSIVGILIFNLILGGIQDTSIDNIGEPLGFTTQLSLLCLHLWKKGCHGC